MGSTARRGHPLTRLGATLLRMAASFVGITMVAFALLHLAPGEPIAAQLGADVPAIGNAGLQEWRELRGLSAPLPVQYGRWLVRLVSLDFGHSLVDERAVTTILADALPTTMLLMGLALFVAYGAGIPLGVWAALHQGRRAERAFAVAAAALIAMPTFWMALLLLTFLASGLFLTWLPLRGLDGAAHLILPVACLAYAPLLRVARYQQLAVAEVLHQDFVRTARAKGIPTFALLARHVLPAAAAPLLALLSVDLPWLVGGSVVIERIFAIPGMGAVAFDAVLRRDYPVILGTTILVALMTRLATALTDALQTRLQPRHGPT